MKNVLILLVVAMTVMSCGPSEQEKAAIQSLEFQLSSLERMETELFRQARKWHDEGMKKKDIDVQYAFLLEAGSKYDELELVQKEIVDVKYKLAQLQ